jgi:signal transduction histidine kinase
VTSRGEGDMAVVEVANVGTPIGEGDQERIFEAFVQADSSDTRRYGGMGLGLHIVRKIVAAYGGRVAVYSEGPLVIFRTWLPVAGPPPAPPSRRVLERLPVVESHPLQTSVHSRP